MRRYYDVAAEVVTVERVTMRVEIECADDADYDETQCEAEAKAGVVAAGGWEAGVTEYDRREQDSSVSQDFTAELVGEYDE